jgi:SAM-dependent methyltransferase
MNHQLDAIHIRTQETASGERVDAMKCLGCGLVFLGDFMEDRTELYNENYCVWGKDNELVEARIKRPKVAAFRYQLGMLKRFIEPGGKKLLDMGTAKGYLLEVACELGFDPYGIELSAYAAKEAAKKFPGKVFNGRLEDAGFSEGIFDVVTATDVIEHISDFSFFSELNKILKPGGLLLITTPDHDSKMRILMGSRWAEYKKEHIFYYNGPSIRFLLAKYGFEVLDIGTKVEISSLGYVSEYLKKYKISPLSGLFRTLLALLPSVFLDFLIKTSFTGDICVIARKKQQFAVLHN